MSMEKQIQKSYGKWGPGVLAFCCLLLGEGSDAERSSRERVFDMVAAPHRNGCGISSGMALCEAVLRDAKRLIRRVRNVRTSQRGNSHIDVLAALQNVRRELRAQLVGATLA